MSIGRSQVVLWLFTAGCWLCFATFLELGAKHKHVKYIMPSNGTRAAIMSDFPRFGRAIVNKLRRENWFTDQKDTYERMVGKEVVLAKDYHPILKLLEDLSEQLSVGSDVEGWFAKGLEAAELLKKHAARFRAELREDAVWYLTGPSVTVFQAMFSAMKKHESEAKDGDPPGIAGVGNLCIIKDALSSLGPSEDTKELMQSVVDKMLVWQAKDTNARVVFVMNSFANADDPNVKKTNLQLLVEEVKAKPMIMQCQDTALVSFMPNQIAGWLGGALEVDGNNKEIFLLIQQFIEQIPEDNQVGRWGPWLALLKPLCRMLHAKDIVASATPQTIKQLQVEDLSQGVAHIEKTAG